MNLIFTVNTHERSTSENSSYRGLRERIRHIGEMGYNCIRINLKQFCEAECDKTDTILSAIDEEIGAFCLPVKVYIDIPYPYQKYRIKLNEKCIYYQREDIVTLCGEVKSSPNKYDINLNPNFFKGLTKGTELVYGDGEGTLKIIEVGDEFVHAEVMNDVKMLSGKSLYGGSLVKQDIPAQYLDYLQLLQKLEIVEAFLFSFCDSGAVRNTFCSLLGERLVKQCFAKIESTEGINSIDDILASFDGVVVARGDLATVCGEKKFYKYHNLIAERAKEKNKKLIFATDIMMSLMHNPCMNRADLIDISNILSFQPDALIFNSDIAYSYRVGVVKNNLKKILD